MPEFLITGLTIIGGTVVRNLFGWWENAFRDGKIDKYEWGQLGTTLLRVALLTVALMYGANLDAFQGMSIGIILDYVVQKVTNALKV